MNTLDVMKGKYDIFVTYKNLSTGIWNTNVKEKLLPLIKNETKTYHNLKYVSFELHFKKFKFSLFVKM